MNTSDERISVTICLPVSTLALIDEIAREQDRSRSRVIARALHDVLAEQAQQRAAVDAAAAEHLREHARLGGFQPKEGQS